MQSRRNDVDIRTKKHLFMIREWCTESNAKCFRTIFNVQVQRATIEHELQFCQPAATPADWLTSTIWNCSGFSAFAYVRTSRTSRCARVGLEARIEQVIRDGKITFGDIRCTGIEWSVVWDDSPDAPVIGIGTAPDMDSTLSAITQVLVKYATTKFSIS